MAGDVFRCLREGAAGLLYQIEYGEADQELGTRACVDARTPGPVGLRPGRVPTELRCDASAASRVFNDALYPAGARDGLPA